MCSYARTESGHVYSWGHRGLGHARSLSDRIGHCHSRIIRRVDAEEGIERLLEIAHITAGYRYDLHEAGWWLFWGLCENGRLPGTNSNHFRRPTRSKNSRRLFPELCHSASILAALGTRKLCASSERLLLATDGSVLRVEWPRMYCSSDDLAWMTLPLWFNVPYLREVTWHDRPKIVAVADRKDTESLVVTQSGQALVLRFCNSQ